MRLSKTWPGAYLPLEGSEVAGWYGYSLASCKVVGGGMYSDLLVGAPLDSRDHDKYPDSGVVYLYYAPMQSVSGELSGGGWLLIGMGSSSRSSGRLFVVVMCSNRFLSPCRRRRGHPR